VSRGWAGPPPSPGKPFVAVNCAAFPDTWKEARKNDDGGRVATSDLRSGVAALPTSEGSGLATQRSPLSKGRTAMSADGVGYAGVLVC
jgi:hypothetical protein